MRQFYLEEVYPRLQLPLQQRYPLVRLHETMGFHPLSDHPVLMLVALTGSGKTTTLRHLAKRVGAAGMGLIPSRRQVADWLALPLMQALSGEPIAPVDDRVARFALTKQLAARLDGGMAALFSWLYLCDSCADMIWSEGIRGENEIRFALNGFPNWQIVELTLHPLTRLRRLSRRRDTFDQAASETDLSFLPSHLRHEARSLLQCGEISAQALTIMRAEAQNYGLHAFADAERYSNFHCIAADDLAVADIADIILSLSRTA